jgi:uncharacterized cupin superfamily protein
MTELQTHNIARSLAGRANLDFHQLGEFNGGSVGVFRCGPGVSPWERHPQGEELLQIIEGSVDIEVLTDTGSEIVSMNQGDVLIVPQGLWHRHRVPTQLAELYATTGSTEHSTAENPNQT